LSRAERIIVSRRLVTREVVSSVSCELVSVDARYSVHRPVGSNREYLYRYIVTQLESTFPKDPLDLVMAVHSPVCITTGRARPLASLANAKASSPSNFTPLDHPSQTQIRNQVPGTDEVLRVRIQNK
jgi:hypothetical protein